jgi:Transglutaminase-like superfamily
MTSTWLRRIVPYTLLPLSLIACVLASAPWLRAFPSDVMAVPLFGAAVLSLLAPLIVVGIGVRRLWLTALIDLLLFVFYELLVTLREPAGFNSLYTGLVHGPAQILSFALPLVSPRTLLVAPVALCWVCGALVGECVARGWQSVLPYLTLMVTFGLSYAGTARAVTSSADGRRYDTLLAAGLLVALLLLRAAQAWVIQEESAEVTQPDGILPLRGLAIGTALAVVIAAAAAGAVQSSAFAGRPVTPARVPPIDQSRPLTPTAFVAGLRPEDPRSKGRPLFKVSIDRPASNYIALGSVDFYNGDGWSFNRTFRPSGGVIPSDPDPSMHSPGPTVTQQYRISDGAITTVPWMPYLSRAERVTGASIDIDATSGMIVPAHPLRPGDEYTVTSAVPGKNFDQLGRNALVGTSATEVDTSLANGLAAPLGTLITSLEDETGTSSTAVIPFLQAVAKELRTKSTLAGAPASATASASTSPTPSGSASSGAHFVAPPPAARPTAHRSTPHRPARRTSPRPKPTPKPTPTLTPTPSASPHTGGTTFADVLASIRSSRSATPEQFATLVALIARKLGVPARVASGFRIPIGNGATSLHEGSYTVRTADAWSWVEIPVSGLGWVVLDPSPTTYAGQTPPRGGTTAPSPSPTPTPSQNAQLTHSNQGGHNVAAPNPPTHGTGLSATAAAIIVLAVLAFVALLLVLILVGRKQVRARRRRRGGDPRRRLLGAWQESIDVLVEAGLPDLTYATNAEVVAAAETRFGGDSAAPARFVGEAANVAIFSPSSWVGPADADAAWRAQALLRKTVRRRLSWRDRMGARLRYNRPHRERARLGPASWADEAKARGRVSRGKHTRSSQRRRLREPSR